MTIKELEKIRNKAGDKLKDNIDIYGNVKEQHRKIACKMRRIIYKESKSIFHDSVICNNSVTSKQRLKMVVIVL